MGCTENLVWNTTDCIGNRLHCIVAGKKVGCMKNFIVEESREKALEKKLAEAESKIKILEASKLEQDKEITRLNKRLETFSRMIEKLERKKK